jgi:hypothetical protein
MKNTEMPSTFKKQKGQEFSKYLKWGKNAFKEQALKSQEL